MPKYSETEEITEQGAELVSHLETLVERFLIKEHTSDLSRREIAVLKAVADQERSTMSELTESLGMACSSATGVVDRLVERGLIERARPADDRRTVHVSLTRRGRHVHESYVENRINLGRGMLEPLDPSERRRLLALFRKITHR